jgi:hypothetical protein
MTAQVVHGEEGQALVIAALAIVVLMGSLALSVDWGYSFLVRRGAQNEADAAVLGAGRYLVSSYVGGSTPFDVSQEEVWCEAKRQRDLNVHSAPNTLTRSLDVSFYSAGGSELDTVSSANCSSPGSLDVPAATRYLRVHTDMTYSTLFGQITREPIRVSTSARVQLTGAPGVRPLRLPTSEIPGVGLSGATTTPNVAMWPIVKHLDASDYNGRSPCGQYCDTTSRRFTLFPDAPSFGNFSGLVTYAHSSPREGFDRSVHQMITESDYTGTETGHGGNASPGRNAAAPGTCSGAPMWDTMGTTNTGSLPGNLALATSCDIPNWFRYGYRGSLSIGTDWLNASWTGFKGALELPDELASSRASCDEAPAYFPVPSCTGSPSLIGDWVETVPGAMTPNMATQMRTFIQEYGRLAPNGRGRAVVVHVFLWDCAESFNASKPPGDRWAHLGRIADEGDNDEDGCRITRRDTRSRSVERVHLVSVVPITVYEADVLTSGPTVTVYAYWGDVFGDAGTCALTTPPSGCALNQLINSAFLVPDE